MPKFYYKARNKEGIPIRGHIEATDSWLARKALSSKDLVALEISRFSLETLISPFQSVVDRFKNRVSIDDKLMFFSQLETGVSIGIPILQLLSFVGGQITNPYLKGVIARITKDVNQGSPLFRAFEKHPDVFDSLSIGLIKTGEKTGELETTLSRLSALLEQQVKTRTKVKSATFYPKIVFVFLGIVVVVMVYFVIPKFKTFLNGLGQDLPLVTKAVLAASDFFVSYWYLFLIFAFVAHIAFDRYVSALKGRILVDRLKLKLPVIGEILVLLELNNYCVMLDLLLTSGLTLSESFEILRDTQSNQLYKNEIDRCAVGIKQGHSFGHALQSSEVFPPAFTSMITIGEESGRLSQALRKLGKYYQIQVDHRLDNLSKMIEPILLVIIFFMVGTLALAVFLPIWKASSTIGKG
jgi:type II secretory pathway component PulF